MSPPKPTSTYDILRRSSGAARVLAAAATSVALLAGCAAESGLSADTDQSEADLSMAGLQLGHYVLNGTPSPGAYGEIVLKSGHRFEAKAYAGTFWEASIEDETTRDVTGTFKTAGNRLTLLTPHGNPYGTYKVTPHGETFAFDFTSDDGRARSFAMMFRDGGTSLDPDAPALDPGTPPSVAGGRRLRCRAGSGKYGTNFSLSRSGGWMYQFAGGAGSRTADHVKLRQNPDEESDDDWVRLVGSSTKAGKDYELDVPAAAFHAGAHGVRISVSAGNAEAGVFTAGEVTCDAADD